MTNKLDIDALHQKASECSGFLVISREEAMELIFRAAHNELVAQFDRIDAIGFQEGRADAAEAELARLREQEPVAKVDACNCTWFVTKGVDMKPPVGSLLYAEPRPAVMPPEMVAEPEKYDVIDHGFIAGYNQAIADVKRLNSGEVEE